MIDVMAGRVPLMFDLLPGVLDEREVGLIAGDRGRLGAARPVASERSDGRGVRASPSFATSGWIGLLAPARTPPQIVDQLHTAVAKAPRAKP